MISFDKQIFGFLNFDQLDVVQFSVGINHVATSPRDVLIVLGKLKSWNSMEFYIS